MRLDLKRWWWVEMLAVFGVADAWLAYRTTDAQGRLDWAHFAAAVAGPLDYWHHGPPRCSNGEWALICLTLLSVAPLTAYACTRHRSALYVGAFFWLVPELLCWRV